MNEGEDVTCLRYTKTVLGLRLHEWERVKGREDEVFVNFGRGSLLESLLEHHPAVVIWEHRGFVI